ncbi:MAG TPA: PAS domain-containing protein [Isosphaeraceae bacterium]|jgi:PAS domain S-box-containing protein|nr:PAS domain-containing protein [Isosphaeraceae bacterium]
MKRPPDPPDFAALFTSAPGSVVVLGPAPEFPIAAVNDAFTRATGLDAVEVVGRSVFEVLPDDADGQARFRASLERVLATRAADRLPLRRHDVRGPTGEGGAVEERYWNAVNFPLVDAGGRITHIVHQSEEVTEVVLLRKRATEREAELAEAIGVYEAVYDQGLFAGRLDLEGRVVHANRACLDPCGFTFEDVVGRPFWECGWWNRSPEVQAWVRRAFEQARGGVPFRGESRYFWADGTERIVEFSCMPIKDAAGAVRFVVPTGIDVTERFEAEQDRRAAAILESITDAFFAVDRDWRFTYVNRQAERVLRRDHGDLIGKVLWDEFPGLEGSEFQRAYLRAAREGVASSITSFYPDHDRWYEVHSYPTPGGISVYFRDVSGRMRAEAERERLAAGSDRERRIYRAALSNTPDLVYVFGLDHRFLYANEALLTMWGRSWDEAIGKNCLELGYEPWHAAMHDREIDQVIATKGPIRGEVPFTGTGGRRIYEYIFVPILGADGTVEAVAGTTRDVTERKAVEETLRRNEKRLRFLQALDDALRPLIDAGEITAAAARVLGQHLDVDRCVYADVEEGEGHFLVTGDYTRGMRSVVGRYALADFGAEPYRLLRSNRPVVVADVEADPRTADGLEAYRRIETRALAVVPLQKAGRLVAAMAVNHREPRAWDPDEVELVRLVADRCWESIERARVTRTLLENEERYRTLAENVPQLFWTCRPDGSCDYLSRQWVDYTGIPEADQLGTNWLRVVHPDDRERTRRSWLDAVADRGGYDLEYRIKGADGSYRWFKVRGTPIRDATGAIGKWFGTCTDIDAQVRAEESLRQADRRKDEFLAMLAHELRNPLAAVGNAANVLKLSDDPGDVGFARDVIDRQARQLARLIDDLLDVSRITRGKIRLRREACDAAAIVGQAIQSVEPLIREFGHRLEADFEPGTLPLRADPTRIEQVVVNLLTNAAKYTERGGHILVRAAREGDQVAITVRDNGIGIPPEWLPQMFELFAQGERTIDRSEGGLGIGLTIVQKLTELHGGTVSAESEGPGRGSTFTVRLPSAARPSPAPPGPAPRPEAGPEPRGARVLVVDDNVDTARGMVRLLKLLGNDVRAAHDGPSAIAAARSLGPDFVLLDIGLPGLDGYEVARRLRAEPRCQASVLIAVSGYGQDDDRRRSREAGFDHHLVKPLDYDALVSLLSRAS